MRRIALSVLLIFGGFLCLLGQEEYSDEKIGEVGINMSTLVSQILPFQESTTLTGAHQLMYLGGKNNRMFSLRVGVNFDFDNPQFLNIALGFVRRRSLGKHFSLNMGYHLMGFAGSYNDPVNREKDVGAVGFGWEIGFQYHFAKRISLYTSSTLFAGPSSEGITVTFLPPVGLFLIARIK